MTRALASVILLVLIGLSVPPAVADDCASGVKSAVLPSVKVGSWWLLHRTSGDEVRIEVKAITGDRIIVLDSSRPGVDVELTKDHNTPDTVGANGQLLRVSPHSRSVSFPICSGKKWGGAINASPTQGTGRGFTYNISAEAKEWSRIDVPAGSFDVIKIEYKTDTGSAICWYAPEAQRNIKCESPSNPRLNFELVKFELSP